MRSFSRQKFNSNFIVAKIGGGESRDFARIFIKTSASISKMHLTKTTTRTKMTAPRNEVGFRSLFLRLGDNSPQLKAVFFCLQFLAHLNFKPCKFIMVAFFGRPLRSVSPSRDTANLINAAANHFAVLRDGFNFRLGITA